MKAAQVDKLYSKLTPTEQAALVFESIARHDNAEADTIASSVERHDYRSTHWQFRRRLMDLMNLSKYYGLIYWKTRTYLSAALYEGKEDMAHQALGFNLLDRLLAMDVALADVCARFNIDVLTVKKLALCEDEAAFSDSGNPELVKEYTDLFMYMLEEA